MLALLTDFDGLREAGPIEPYVPSGSGEYWILEKKFGMSYHTFAPRSSVSPEQLIAREERRLPFLCVKLMEDIALGHKMFVLGRPDVFFNEEALAVWAALNKVHENSLLFLVRTGEEPPGAVVKIGPGLFKGYTDNESGDVATSVSVWLSVCSNAFWLSSRSKDDDAKEAYAG